MRRCLPIAVIGAAAAWPRPVHAGHDDPRLRLVLRNGRSVCAPAVWRATSDGVHVQPTLSEAASFVPRDSIIGAWTTGEPTGKTLFTPDGVLTGAVLAVPAAAVLWLAATPFRPGQPDRQPGQAPPEARTTGGLWTTIGVGAAIGVVVEAIVRARRLTRWTWRGDLAAPSATESDDLRARAGESCANAAPPVGRVPAESPPP